jgi:hypothetical protein
MIIECFTAVGSGLATSTVRNLVKSGPKHFKHFAIDHARSWNKCWRKSSVAVINMAMDVK